MVKVDRQAINKRIVNMYLNNIEKGKSFVVNHFKMKKYLKQLFIMY